MENENGKGKQNRPVETFAAWCGAACALQVCESAPFEGTTAAEVEARSNDNEIMIM